MGKRRPEADEELYVAVRQALEPLETVRWHEETRREFVDYHGPPVGGLGDPPPGVEVRYVTKRIPVVSIGLPISGDHGWDRLAEPHSDLSADPELARVLADVRRLATILPNALPEIFQPPMADAGRHRIAEAVSNLAALFRRPIHRKRWGVRAALEREAAAHGRSLSDELRVRTESALCEILGEVHPRGGLARRWTSEIRTLLNNKLTKDLVSSSKPWEQLPEDSDAGQDRDPSRRSEHLSKLRKAGLDERLYVPPRMPAELGEWRDLETLFAELAPRQQEFMLLLGGCDSEAEAGRRMGLSPSTARGMLGTIKRKAFRLGLRGSTPRE